MRAVWQALPGEDWPARLAEAAAIALAAGRGALLVVPDARDLERLDKALAGPAPAPRRTSRSPPISARPSDIAAI